jgi:hypothetical protein
MKASARRLVPWALLAAAYAAALVAPFRVFLPRFTTHLIGDHGDALLQHLHCAWQWLALAEGRASELLALPTMHPYRSGFVFGETLLGVTLPLAPLHLLTGSTAATFNTAVVLSFPLLALAVFLWVRELFHSPAAGLLAAILVAFTPWRVHYLSALNVLTVHYAIFGMWLLSRWLVRPALPTLLGAALLFHLQLVTSAQVALAAIYLSCIWLLAVWLGSARGFERRRVGQIAVAASVFLGLGLPWLDFFREAFDATPGLLRTGEMASYSAPFPAMARQLGALGPLGIFSAAGSVALALGYRRGWLSRVSVLSLSGLALGSVALFVVGRGPYLGPETDPTALPGYYAARWLPLLGAVRAPLRLAAMTPVFLAMLAGGGLAMAERWTLEKFSGRWARAWLLFPLLLALLWPALPPGMAAPIAQRPPDRSLAAELARLPASAVILSLPMDPEPSGAAVDERVLVHRRAQIGGFASIVAEPFRHAMRRLGQWPYDGTEAARALGATHLVVPARWLGPHGAAIAERGYKVVVSVAGRAVLSLPPARREAAELRYVERRAAVGSATLRGFLLEVPTAAAAGRWLTFSLSPAQWSFDPRAHRSLVARWTGPEGVVEVGAHAFSAGITGPDAPIQIHVPTPESTGPHELIVDHPAGPIEAAVDIRAAPTSLDAAVRDVSITLATGYRTPGSVRAGQPFRVDVSLTVGPAAPILLATSRCDLPERCGEIVLSYQFRRLGRPQGLVASAETPPRTALSRDLIPGDGYEQTWYLRPPPLPGRYALFVRLGAHGSDAHTAWIQLIDALRVTLD